MEKEGIKPSKKITLDRVQVITPKVCIQENTHKNFNEIFGLV
jgi:hypothetical protein